MSDIRTFKEFLEDQRKTDAAQKKREDVVPVLQSLFEHETYKKIPGTSCSYRQDPARTSTLTQKHVHTYAKLKGRGEEMYSVNLDGSGHDGSSGIEIPKAHADFFRSKGYKIPDTNILECLDVCDLDEAIHIVLLLEDA